MVASLGMLAAATAVAFLIATAGVDKQDQQPVLALSSPAYGGTDARILVRSLNAAGAYELHALPDGQRRGGYSQPVKLGVKGSDSTELSLRLPPARCYWKVVLSPPGRPTATERELILWAGMSSAGIQRETHKRPLPLAGGGPHGSGSCSSPGTGAP
jgi:hypothetical protein